MPIGMLGQREVCDPGAPGSRLADSGRRPGHPAATRFGIRAGPPPKSATCCITTRRRYGPVAWMRRPVPQAGWTRGSIGFIRCRPRSCRCPCPSSRPRGWESAQHPMQGWNSSRSRRPVAIAKAACTNRRALCCGIPRQSRVEARSRWLPRQAARPAVVPRSARAGRSARGDMDGPVAGDGGAAWRARDARDSPTTEATIQWAASSCRAPATVQPRRLDSVDITPGTAATATIRLMAG
jgi:hypothetical protein